MTIKAKCKAIFEIECSAVFAADAKMEDIVKQAEADAHHRIHKLFDDANKSSPDIEATEDGRIKYLGLTAVMTSVQTVYDTPNKQK